MLSHLPPREADISTRTNLSVVSSVDPDGRERYEYPRGGGNIKYGGVDHDLQPVGNKGERLILMDPPGERASPTRWRDQKTTR